MNQDPEATETEDGAAAEAESPSHATDSEASDPKDPQGGANADIDIPAAADASSEALEELERVRDRHLRLAAEFDNYRKRMDNELTSAWSRAQADLVGRLLDGLDDLQRVGAWEATNTTVEALIEGVDLVERKLFQALQTAGLEGVDPTGERFDPNTMEAMMKVPAEDETEDNQVHQTFQKGYVFKGQLVRPARVSVLTHD